MCKSIPIEKKYSLKDIFDLYWSDYLNDVNRKFYITDYHLKTINTIRCCQTARLGLYRFACTGCGDTHQLPRSCKNRFCSNCGASDTMDWVRKLSLKLPDIKHHHVVFTLPKELRGLCKKNKKKFYQLLFQSAQEVLKCEFKNRYDLEPGIIIVLHTNGSDLKYHPHVHVIISSGGMLNSGKIEELKKDYLFPQRLLANNFRSLFIKKLESFISKGEVLVSGPFKRRLPVFLKNLKEIQWIVNIDKPLEGVERIIAYVGRYTKKSCISERRIESIENGRIRISYKDYKNSKRGEKPKDSRLTMSSTEFLDRLLEHIPEKGFKVVRYYGLYSSSKINQIPKDLRIKELKIDSYDLAKIEEEEIDLCPFKKYRKQVYERTGKDPLYCYHCAQSMKLIDVKYENKSGGVKIIEVYDSG